MSYPEGLLNRQNSDGGWGYHGGGSWTEPTCYALLALAAGDLAGSQAARRGALWLARCQRPDGGLAPRESVAESTWLTALSLLLPAGLLAGGVDRRRAGSWVLHQTGRESGWAYRLRLWMLGSTPQVSFAFDGWPWFTGTAAWIIPTAISILALEKLGREGGGSELSGRIAQGRAFLLARRCRDGGWNHGSTKALGYDSDSYPETTGIALLALHGSAAPELSQAVTRGEQHLARCQSSEAANWLTLGLLVHGRNAAAPPLAAHGTTMEIALAALAESARGGRNFFLES
jgi:prenyltransferase/squalene oxidase-like repeat protein